MKNSEARLVDAARRLGWSAERNLIFDGTVVQLVLTPPTRTDFDIRVRLAKDGRIDSALRATFSASPPRGSRIFGGIPAIVRMMEEGR